MSNASVASAAYPPRRASRSAFHELNGMRYHVREWGEPGAPALFLLHGWMDVSASFQFLVDAFARERHVIAPDWRGFGLTGWAPGGYWFPDYYADLDALLDRYAPGAAVDLVGHSMGGNVACNYAGIRPQRVRRLASLEGFGATRTRADEAPARYAQWLDEKAAPPAFGPYPSFEAVAARLRKNNPRLPDDKACFLAQHWAREEAPGRVVLASDPRHKMVNPVLNRVEEVLACWQCYAGPTLWVAGAQSKARGWTTDTPAQLAERKAAFRDFREFTLEDCGHMLHHDQPARLAAILEEFFCVPG
ncbi:MAG: alpha/beta fold hydrolase [Burkholderiales bacterium]